MGNTSLLNSCCGCATPGHDGRKERAIEVPKQARLMAANLHYAELKEWMMRHGYDMMQVEGCSSKAALISLMEGEYHQTMDTTSSGVNGMVPLAASDRTVGMGFLTGDVENRGGCEGWCNQHISGYGFGFQVKNLSSSLKGWKGALVLIAIFDKHKPGILDVRQAMSLRDKGVDPAKSVTQVVQLFHEYYDVPPYLTHNHLMGPVDPLQTKRYLDAIMSQVNKAEVEAVQEVNVVIAASAAHSAPQPQFKMLP